VRKLRKAGKSLRWIAEETSLGLNTVRTILAKANGATRKHLARIKNQR
jgi:DNA-binding CsgD family transcriptional regulator